MLIQKNVSFEFQAGIQVHLVSPASVSILVQTASSNAHSLFSDFVPTLSSRSDFRLVAELGAAFCVHFTFTLLPGDRRLQRDTLTQGSLATTWAALSSTSAPSSPELSLVLVSDTSPMYEFIRLFPTTRFIESGEASGGCGEDESAFMMYTKTSACGRSPPTHKTTKDDP